MTYCNQDKCIFNYDETCTKKDTVLSVNGSNAWKDNLICLSYKNNQEEK